MRLPAALQGVFFDVLWEKEKVWALPTRPEPAALDELAWQLDLPVWSTRPPEPLFDLAPSAVLVDPDAHPLHWERIVRSDLERPLELFRKCGRWVVLDGYHRLAHHAVAGSAAVPVRRHDDAIFPRILRDAPPEDPDAE